MVRFLLVILLALSLQVPTAFAADWTRVVRQLRVATVPITCADHRLIGCTAFSINTREGYYLTAEHCISEVPTNPETGLQEELRVDGKPIVILYRNADLDLVVFKGAKRRPALQPRQSTIEAGMELGSFGYAWGMNGASFRASNLQIIYKVTETGVITLIWDTALIRGMSGGPTVDRDGRVVSINQRSDTRLGFGATGVALSVMWEQTKKFWEYQSD